MKLESSPSWRRRFIAAFVVIAASFFVPHLKLGSYAISPAAAESKEGLSAFQTIATVLRHPRCLNCHQESSPLQGDDPHPHVPKVTRGPDNHGVIGMRCGACHSQTGNNPNSGVPGAPHWQLAPASMKWQGLSDKELCQMFKDPARNGGKDGAALVEHMENDPLVAWGWNPGSDRESVSVSRAETVMLMEVWVADGMPCPE